MSIADSFSSKNRGRKLDLFMRELNPSSDTTILDVGYEGEEYAPASNYLEKHYPYRSNITALGIDDPTKFIQRYPDIKAVRYDGKVFPFDDKSFDICWSNAVIEHVGKWDDQVFFLKETVRTSRIAYLTTPNRLFPIEVHTRTPFLHWLPKDLFDSYLRKVGKNWATGDYMNLLTSWNIRGLMADAGIEKYKILRNRLMGFTLDYVIIFGDI